MGFSLVELSIVLVILGLLVGGILAGKSLIRAAEIRAVGTEYQRTVTAVNSFRDKYFALPGDMANATSVWGIAAGTGNDNTCLDQASTDARTCNGDGDGQILGTPSNEVFRFWQHLANAGLIEGSYSGKGVSGNASSSMYGYTSGLNVPRSKIQGAGFHVSYSSQGSTGNGTFYPYAPGNLMLYGAITTITNMTTPILSTEEAWNIDTKLDDGRPAYGKIVTYKNGASAGWATQLGQCANDTNAATATYDFTMSGPKCAISFLGGF